MPSIEYKTPRWSAYLAYTYTDATYQSGFVEAAGSNPAADANGNITISPGDRLPGVRRNQGKLGVTYKVTDALDASAASLLAQSGQYLFGDEANLTPQLPAFRHAEPEHQLSAYAAYHAVRLGGERDGREILYLRHVLADSIGVSGAGAECNQPACLQPRRAGWRVRRHSRNVLRRSLPAYSPAARFKQAKPMVPELNQGLLKVSRATIRPAAVALIVKAAADGARPSSSTRSFRSSRRCPGWLP